MVMSANPDEGHGRLSPRPARLSASEAEAIWDSASGTWDDHLQHIAFVTSYVSFGKDNQPSPRDLHEYLSDFDLDVTLWEAVSAIREDEIPAHRRDDFARARELASSCLPHQGQTASFLDIVRVFIGINEELFASYRTRPEAPLRALYALLGDPFIDDVPFSSDRCVLVRMAMAMSNFCSESDARILERDRLAVVREQFVSDSELSVGGDSTMTCGCTPGYDELLHAFEAKDSLVPDPGRGLRPAIRQVQDFAWATQPNPAPIIDYMFGVDALAYLKRSIPNQFSMGVDGHGINSYALSSRFVLGPFAGLIQVGWGPLGGQGRQLELWEEVSDLLQSTLERIQWRDHDLLKPDFSLKKRDCIILCSELRNIYEIHTRIGDTDEWDELECESAASLFESIAFEISRLMPNPPVIPQPSP
jgi:hypothetical protein